MVVILRRLNPTTRKGRIMASNYVIGCGGGYWVLDSACVPDPNDATPIRYLKQAQRYAELLNQIGYCGGTCRVYTLHPETTTVTDKTTGHQVEVLVFKAKAYVKNA
jgi:hypothetical protein